MTRPARPRRTRPRPTVAPAAAEAPAAEAPAAAAALRPTRTSSTPPSAPATSRRSLPRFRPPVSSPPPWHRALHRLCAERRRVRQAPALPPHQAHERSLQDRVRAHPQVSRAQRQRESGRRPRQDAVGRHRAGRQARGERRRQQGRAERLDQRRVSGYRRGRTGLFMPSTACSSRPSLIPRLATTTARPSSRSSSTR